MLEDAEQIIAAWNNAQANGMPTFFAPAIGLTIAAIRFSEFTALFLVQACEVFDSVLLGLYDVPLSVSQR